MHSILVKDYMDHNPHAIPDTATVRDVVALLIQSHIIGAPVVDSNKHVVGFVSEQDCIKQVLNDAFFCDEPPLVTQVMNRNVATVTPETSILEIAETMSQRPPKNYPVVENGKLVGLISRSRILRALVATADDCYLF